jgi:tight adherence protein C
MTTVVVMLVFATVFCAAIGIVTSTQRPVQARLRQYAAHDDASPYDLMMAKPLAEKLLLPLLQRLGGFIQRLTPVQVVADVDKRLRQADHPFGLTVSSFLLSKMAMCLSLPVFYAIWTWTTSRGDISLIQMIITGTMFFVGYRGPDWWLDHKVSTRQREINHSLPDALDLIVICSEAGLALEGAMARVVDRLQGALADELRRTLGEISFGKRRRDALRALADRTEAQDLVSFVAAVVQADQTGISVGNVLRIQAEDLRLRRRQRAEKEGRQAPLKMLFPNILFIFPATLIVLIGPAGLQIADQLFTGS